MIRLATRCVVIDFGRSCGPCNRSKRWCLIWWKIYAFCVEALEHALERGGSSAPHTEALALISLLEGSTTFLGNGRRRAMDAMSMRAAVSDLLDNGYGGKGRSEI
jgi:hypothetical protein